LFQRFEKGKTKEMKKKKSSIRLQEGNDANGAAIARPTSGHGFHREKPAQKGCAPR